MDFLLAVTGNNSYRPWHIQFVRCSNYFLCTKFKNDTWRYQFYLYTEICMFFTSYIWNQFVTLKLMVHIYMDDYVHYIFSMEVFYLDRIRNGYFIFFQGIGVFSSWRIQMFIYTHKGINFWWVFAWNIFVLQVGNYLRQSLKTYGQSRSD